MMRYLILNTVVLLTALVVAGLLFSPFIDDVIRETVVPKRRLDPFHRDC